jgi:hypothetical protein
VSDIADKVAAIKAPKPRKGDEDRARLTVASNAKDAEDCLMLLDMLGLPVRPVEQQRKAS